MLTKKSLVILAGMLIVVALFTLASWSTAPVLAQGPTTPTPQPPTAVLKVVAVPGVATDKNAITATIKVITATEVGPADRVVALSTTGGGNVPINVPVHIAVSAADPKNTGKPTWALTKPTNSKAAIKDAAAMTTEFTPDVVGAYYVSVSLKGDTGTSNTEFAFFNAGTYIGVYTGNCKQCHPEQATEWAKTGHALVMPMELDNKVNGPRGMESEYAETCSACHTTGYYPAPFNGSGGYFDAKAKANWTFPTWKQINDVWAKKSPSIYDALPTAVKDMATIGCEQCHGPAGEHVKNGAKVMEASFSNDVCNQCHGTRGGHTRGVQLSFSKHSDETGAAWGISGPEEQQCVRCHTAKGYVSFLDNPTNAAAWNNEAQTLTCAGCHDPHSEANAFQLRVVAKPVGMPFEVKRDVGLSATCYECHNARRNGDEQAKNAADGKAVSTPHYSSAAELIENTGGITYGQTLPQGSHSMVNLGGAPMANPAYDPKNGESPKFLFSAIGDDKGNTPGACVVCHMWPAITAANDPLALKVGGHSFNTVTPDGKAIYSAGCKSCHGDLKTFNIPAKADYDGNGKVEGVQDEVKGLLTVLWAQLEAKGVKKVATGNPYATLPGTDNKDYPKIAQAWYNFRTVYGVMWGTDTGDGNQGKGAAIHNFKRSVSLLQLSYKDLTGQDVPGATLMK